MSITIAQENYNTNAQAFIAKRGALIMKEFANVGSLTGESRSKLKIETLVFSSMQGAQIERAYGLKIKIQTCDDGFFRDEACLIDQDELPELINGITY
ncbi:MAG: hypothetical protein VKM92_05785, partial [Cyanobacteriota bacterium]|nr:hypothetical protein [Cyanobacteriota bacterium]